MGGILKNTCLLSFLSYPKRETNKDSTRSATLTDRPLSLSKGYLCCVH